MKRLIYTSAAQRDLADIQDYVEDTTEDVRVAESVVSRLRAQCRKLAELSGTLGRPRSELLPGLRSFPSSGYVIFFEYRGDDLAVVKVLSERQDVSAHLGAADD